MKIRDVINKLQQMDPDATLHVCVDVQTCSIGHGAYEFVADEIWPCGFVLGDENPCVYINVDDYEKNHPGVAE